MKLYCGVDLHSNNGVYVVIDENDKKLLHRRLPNDKAKHTSNGKVKKTNNRKNGTAFDVKRMFG